MLSHEQKKYFRKAEQAIFYVRSNLIYGSNTEKDSKLPSWEPQRILALRQEVKQQAKAYALQHGGVADFSIISELNRKALKKFGFGNCGEQAQSAFIFLKKCGVSPLDFCVTTEGGHNLVVLGRNKSSDPNDSSTWGPDAVVCDPWAEKIYLLSEFKEMQKIENDVRYAAVCYKYFSPPPYLSGALISKYRIETPETRQLVSNSIFNKEKIPDSRNMLLLEENLGNQCSL